MGLEVFLVELDYLRVRVLGDVPVGESYLVEYGSSVVLFRIPASYDPTEGAMANEVTLNRKVG